MVAKVMVTLAEFQGFKKGTKKRAEKGTQACALTVFLHLSKLSHRNLRFAPRLKLSM